MPGGIVFKQGNPASLYGMEDDHGWFVRLNRQPAQHCFKRRRIMAVHFCNARAESAPFVGVRGNEEYAIKDDKDILEFYDAHKEDDAKTLAGEVLSNQGFWGEDLTEYEGLLEKVAADLGMIGEKGAYELMRQCLG